MKLKRFQSIGPYGEADKLFFYNVLEAQSSRVLRGIAHSV